MRPSHVLSETKLYGQFTVARVIGLLKRGQRPGTELYMPDGTELWHEVEKAATHPGQPCAVTDLDGRPWMYQPNDARDIAHCIVCALESDAAIGEAFNGGAPAPFSFIEGARLLGEIKQMDPVEVRLPVRSVYDHDITKAKSLIGYLPKGDLETMMDSARRFDAGEPDYTWD